MGAGASSKKASDGHASRHSSKARDRDFKAICKLVFDEADRNKNGLLDEGEFWFVLESCQLNLNLSSEEINEIRKLAEADGPLPPISYEHFVPMFRGLLQQVYAHNDTDWNDWCMCKEPNSGKVYYLNKRTNETRTDQPENFNPERVEEQSFEYVTIDDVELTTTITEDGTRMYMDWETQEWRELPEEWLKQATVKTDFQRGQTLLNLDATDTSDAEDPTRLVQQQTAQQQGVESIDPRVGEYMHPQRGLMHTYLFENTRNTRIYYDNRVNNWARMPLGWERNVSEVTAMLDEIDMLLPRWKNVNEQMLTLRECNYDLQDTIIFAEINWGYKPGDASVSSKLDRQRTRGVAGFGDEAEEDLGVLSKAAANKIHDLSTKLAAANKRIENLESEKAEAEQKEVRHLKRENTRLDGTLLRTSNKVKESDQKLQEMGAKIVELQSKLSETERELLAAKADGQRIAQLDAQLAALQKGGGETDAALRTCQAELQRASTENTHLKMKVQQLKEQLDSPAKSSATRTLIGKVLGELRQIQAEKKSIQDEFNTGTTAVQTVLDKAAHHTKGLELAINSKVDEITTKYRAEVLQRKLLYNKLQELRGNIRVFLRVRSDDRGPTVMQFPNEAELIIPTLQNENITFDFDRVYSPSATQEQVFSDTKQVLMSVVDGYNVCLMAYGQTGSGKTYTMMGSPDNPGVNRRAITELLSLVKNDDKVEATITASICEVYNEQVYDLLSNKRVPRKLKQRGVRDCVAEGIVERKVTTMEDVQRVLKDSDRNRSVSATAMNTDSSRSHLVFILGVEVYNSISGVTSSGRLTLVDLAGSERIARSQASGDRLAEAAAINKSLSALGQCFAAISARAPHVPYRNSKLTHLLQGSLGGDSKTCMFINCSPLQENLSETHSTLNFGRQIRSIELGPASKKTTKGPPGPPRPMPPSA